MRNKNRNAVVTYTLVLATGLLLLNSAFSIFFVRWDLSLDKKFTLSKASVTVLNKLNSPIFVRVYFTDALPIPYGNNRRIINDLLAEYGAAAGGRFTFEIIDPAREESAVDKDKKKGADRDVFGRAIRERTSIEKELAEFGIEPVEISVIEDDQQQSKRAYMGLVVHYQNKKEAIPLVENTVNLERDLTGIIARLSQARRPVLALVHNSEFSPLNNFRRLIEKSSEITDLDLSSEDQAAIEADGLLVIGRGSFSGHGSLDGVRDFINQGKKVAFLLDRIEVDPETMRARKPEMLDGDDAYVLLASFGARFDNHIVADVNCASLTIQEPSGSGLIDVPIKYPLIPELIHIDQQSNITRGLTGIVFPFSAPIMLTKVPGFTFRSLAESTKMSWLEAVPVDLNPKREWHAADIKMNGPHVLLAEISRKSTPINRQIVVGGTSSFLWDDFLSGSNEILASNLIAWLMADTGLIPVRTRAFSDSPIDPDIRESTRVMLKYGNIFGPPGLLISYGLWRWRRRESRRNRPS